MEKNRRSFLYFSQNGINVIKRGQGVLILHMKKELLLTEGVVGQIESYNVGTANIWTRDGKLSVQISIWNAIERVKKICAKGDKLAIGSLKIVVKDVKENDNGTGSVTLTW